MEKQQWIEDMLSKMTLEQKIGQCVVVGMSGTVITNDIREAITRYHCSGLRLSGFTRMFRYFTDSKAKKQEFGDDFIPSMEKIAHGGLPVWKSPEEYAEMLNELRQLAASRNPSIPLHMVVDQEGDTSRDFARGGVVQFPSSMGLVAGDSPDRAYRVAKAVAKQMKASGMDMIHSPVVDVNINPKNPEIGRRAYSDDPQVVAEYAIAQLKGYKEHNVIAAAKHFPGRGDSAVDAHHACPTLNVELKRFHDVELYPYKKLIEAGIDSIMAAHCMYPFIDADHISTVSRDIITGLLREELNFQGMITTDSMTMGALIDRYGVGESCARALAAGADIILMKAENRWRGEMFHTIKQWVEEGKIPEEELNDKVRRVLSVKKKYGLFDNMGIVDSSKAAEPYKEKEIIDLSVEAAEHAAMIVKDELGAMPLDTNKKVLLINQQVSIKSPNDSYDHPSIFQEMLESEFSGLQTYETLMEYSDEDEEGVMDYVKNNKFDLIICTNYYDRQAKPHEYPKKLIDAGYPVLLITNTPYCIKDVGGLLPGAKSAILNMNLTPQGLKTTIDILFKRITPKGKWPLSNYNPFNL